MAIETKEEFGHARIALDRRKPEALATFILSLVRAPNGIGSYVHAFIAADDPPAAAGIVRDEIAFLRAGEREYGYRHRRAFGFVTRLDRALDIVEAILLPANPAVAVEALALLIENDYAISDNCHEDDFGAAEAFKRARELFLTTAGE